MKDKLLCGVVGALVLLGCPTTYASAPIYSWSQRFGGGSTDIGLSVASDGLGNIVVTGVFVGSIDLGGGSLTASGIGYDIFIAKYDQNGTHQWSQRFGDVLDDEGRSVVIDAAGNIFVTGEFVGAADFGGGSLSSAGGQDIFLAKFSPGGAHQWSHRFGGTGDQTALSVAVDEVGNVLLAGRFQGSVDFGTGLLNSAGDADIFVTKFNSDGVCHWSKRFGTGYVEMATSVKADGFGNVLLTGFFADTVDFGGGPLYGAGSNEGFVAKFDQYGVHQWSRRFGSSGVDYPNSIAVDGIGNVVVAGFFQGSVDFGGGTIGSAGSTDIFLVKWSADGAHQWSKGFGDVGDDWNYGVAVNPSGDIFITGLFHGSVDFGGGPLTSDGLEDIFVAKFNAAGAHEWSRRFGGPGKDIGWCARAGVADVIVTGSFEQSVDFGGGALQSVGGSDIFVLKLNDSGPVSTSRRSLGSVKALYR